MRNWLMALRVALCVLGVLWFAPVPAGEAPPVAEDPVLEKRMMKIAEDLRCLVCQNQNVADSHAELAIDFKNEIRRLLREGKTDEEVRAFMVQRYGDFVLYNPPVKTTTWLLWLGPFVLMLAGLFMLVRKLKQRNKIQANGLVLSDDEHRRALDLLQGGLSVEKTGDKPGDRK